MINCSM